MAIDLGALLAELIEGAKPAVLGIETLIGVTKAGADKQTIAKVALAGLTATAEAVLTGDNAQYAGIASVLMGWAIDSAVSVLKLSGKYQAATAQAAAMQTVIVTPAP